MSCLGTESCLTAHANKQTHLHILAEYFQSGRNPLLRPWGSTAAKSDGPPEWAHSPTLPWPPLTHCFHMYTTHKSNTQDRTLLCMCGDIVHLLLRDRPVLLVMLLHSDPILGSVVGLNHEHGYYFLKSYAGKLFAGHNVQGWVVRIKLSSNSVTRYCEMYKLLQII